MTNFTIKAFEQAHHKWAKELLARQMGSHLIVSRSILYDPLDYPGFVAIVDGQPKALATYRVEYDSCELMTIHSELEGLGLGTALIERVKQAARDAGSERLWAITTNDNVHAFRWYQKRGFTLAALHRHALDHSRQLKPEIPENGIDGIPIRDEIEFEIQCS